MPELVHDFGYAIQYRHQLNSRINGPLQGLST